MRNGMGYLFDCQNINADNESLSNVIFKEEK